MYKLYAMRGMIVQDIDRFISNRLPSDTLEKLNMTHEELRSLIEKQPYVSVKSLDSLTESEMLELEFLVSAVGGFEDVVETNFDSDIKN